MTFAVGYAASYALASTRSRPSASAVYCTLQPCRAPINANATRPELSRDLGVSHASAVVVGTIIGSGIFLVPAEMMQAVGSAKLVYLAWLVGGLLSFFGALTYAELGAMKPQAGGEYVYVRDAYGPLGGFLYALDVVRHREARVGRYDRDRTGAHSGHVLHLFFFL